jgi:hypothetical protein
MNRTLLQGRPYRSGPELRGLYGNGLFMHLCMAFMPWFIFALEQGHLAVFGAVLFVLEALFLACYLRQRKMQTADGYYRLKWLAMGDLLWPVFGVGMILNAGVLVIPSCTILVALAAVVMALNIREGRAQNLVKLTTSLRRKGLLVEDDAGQIRMFGDAGFEAGAPFSDKIRTGLHYVSGLCMVIAIAAMILPLKPFREIDGLPLLIFGMGAGLGAQILFSPLLRDLVITCRLAKLLSTGVKS